MSDFTNQQPRDTYPAILSLESNLISSSFKNVQDSKGNATALSLSTDGVKSEGKLWVTTATTTTTEQYALMRDQSTGEIYQQNISVAPGDVPASRQLTIQGTLREVEVSAPNTQNLSADRTWTIGLPDVVEITTSLSVPTLYTTSTVNMSGIPSSVTDTKALMLAPSDNLVYRTLGTYAFLSSVDFGDLADVDMTGLSDGYGIYYNSGTGNWEVGPAGGGGVTTFIALTDTPGAYAGSGEYFVKVNSGATALEFVNLVEIADINATGSPGATTFLRGDGAWAVPAGGSADGYIGDATNPSGDAWHTAGAELRMGTLPIEFGSARSASISIPTNDWIFEIPTSNAAIFQAGSDTFLTMERNVGTKIYHDDVTIGNNLAFETFTSGTQVGSKIYGLLWIADIEVTGHAYADGEVDDGNSSTADTIDWTTGNFHKSTMTGNCTYTFTAPSGATTLILKLAQGGSGSYTATWPATVKWTGGTAPTLSTAVGAIDIITFYWDGTNYLGTSVLNLS